MLLGKHVSILFHAFSSFRFMRFPIDSGSCLKPKSSILRTSMFRAHGMPFFAASPTHHKAV